MKEQDKTPEKEQSEMEMSSLPDRVQNNNQPPTCHKLRVSF